MTSEYRLYNWLFDLDRWALALEQSGLTDAEIAAFADVDESTVNNWRKLRYGNPRVAQHPSMGNFLKVCNHLDLDPREFFMLDIPF